MTVSVIDLKMGQGLFSVVQNVKILCLFFYITLSIQPNNQKELTRGPFFVRRLLQDHAQTFCGACAKTEKGHPPPPNFFGYILMTN